MLLQDLIHTTKAHPWWVVAFVLPLVVVAALRLFTRRKALATEHLATSSVLPGSAEEQGQLRRTTHFGVLHGERFDSSLRCSRFHQGSAGYAARRCWAIYPIRGNVVAQWGVRTLPGWRKISRQTC